MANNLLPCKCGGKARYMYRVPTHFVECRNKTCPYQMRTRYYPDVNGNDDVESKRRAIDEWNMIVAGANKTNLSS